MDKKIKFKVLNNYNNKDSDVSKFSIAYSARNIDMSQVSYEIISALKSEGDIIFEVNSSLLNSSDNNNKTIISSLIDSLERMGIEYQDKRKKIDAKRAIFSIQLQGKKIEGYEVFALIPHNIWCDQEFRKIIPKIGVRYYLLKTGSENDLDTFTKLDEDVRIDLCSMVIFDHILLGSMGINTTIMKKDDIAELLKK